MRKTLLVLALGLAVVAFVAAGCGGSDDEGAGTQETTTETTGTGGEAGGQELNASVGPGFEISLTTPDGADVTSLPAGEYTITVNDQSDIHNFHLTGPGDVDVSTTVEEVVETTWTVTLVSGEYTFVCDPHASSMNGSFTVT
jgi:plastocyanin